MRRMLGAALKLPIRFLLEQRPIRSRVVMDLRQRHFDEFECNIALGTGLVCPVYRWEELVSFGHIFFENEYGRAFSVMPVPDRWLDIGCYAGYFSLFVERARREQGRKTPPEALLIDGDSRSAGAVQKLTALNRFDRQFRFRHGVIANQDADTIFVERPFMTSSIGGSAADGVPKHVSRVSEIDILEALPPPYDLIKIDIEGGEYHFLREYPRVLASADRLLMEWHSWHPGGGGLQQLEALAGERGFIFEAEVLTPHDEAHRHGPKPSGVRLYRRSG